MLRATDELLSGLIPKYFEPEALSAVVGGKKVVTKFPASPFDFIFVTGSVGVGRVVMQAAAGHLTPVLLELRGQNPAIVNETANIPGCRPKNCFGAHGMGRTAAHLSPGCRNLASGVRRVACTVNSNELDLRRLDQVRYALEFPSWVKQEILEGNRHS